MKIVPAAWMPNSSAKRIVVHWSAGAYKASAEDRAHYHLMIESDGTLVRGDHAISDNDVTSDDDYAAHTRGANTGAIGVAICAMAGAVERPFNAGKYPITEIQWEVLADVCAQLSRRYEIPVRKDHILSHAEVQPTLGITQRGKWDIAVLPFDPSVSGAIPVGDRLREMIRKRLSTPAGPPVQIPQPDDPGPVTPDLSGNPGCRNIFRNLFRGA